MVDALASVELAIFLRDSGQTESIDPTLQSHGLNITQSDAINITGHAWGQSGSVDMVEYRVGQGPWYEATYSDIPGEVGALTPFLWHIILDPGSLPEGQHTVEVHASAGESHSLPVFYEVSGEGGGNTAQGVPTAVVGIVVLVAMAWVGSLVLVRLRSDDEIEGLLPSMIRPTEGVIDAEMVD
jgi:hypothetical protein